MNFLTDKRVYMLLLLVTVLGVVALSAFRVDIPKVLNDLIYGLMGGGLVGAGVATKKTS